MKDVIRYLRVLLFALPLLVSGAEPASYEYWITGNSADAQPARTRAGLFLTGGVVDVLPAWKWFVSCAGGGDVVVLRASGGDGYQGFVSEKIGGADSVETIRFNDASAARDPRVLEIIAHADGIFLPVGTRKSTCHGGKGRPSARPSTPISGPVSRSVAPVWVSR